MISFLYSSIKSISFDFGIVIFSVAVHHPFTSESDFHQISHTSVPPSILAPQSSQYFLVGLSQLPSVVMTKPHAEQHHSSPPRCIHFPFTTGATSTASSSSSSIQSHFFEQHSSGYKQSHRSHMSARAVSMFVYLAIAFLTILNRHSQFSECPNRWPSKFAGFFGIYSASL